jgi:hypothetical protein
VGESEKQPMKIVDQPFPLHHHMQAVSNKFQYLHRRDPQVFFSHLGFVGESEEQLMEIDGGGSRSVEIVDPAHGKKRSLSPNRCYMTLASCQDLSFVLVSCNLAVLFSIPAT